MSFSRFVDDITGKDRGHLAGRVFVPPLRRGRSIIPDPEIYFESTLNSGRFWNRNCPVILLPLYVMIT